MARADGRPILFLPSRDRVSGITEGWVDVTADGEPYKAIFAKIAVNVMTRGADERNELPTLMRKWFGGNAGWPGTDAPSGVRAGGGTTGRDTCCRRSRTWTVGAGVWRRYARKDVPKLFGFEFRGFESQPAVVTLPGLMCSS